ncbi:hypothetical protein RCL1_005989 [Eukaryota sp. TZLM3-RCL]
MIEKKVRHSFGIQMTFKNGSAKMKIILKLSPPIFFLMLDSLIYVLRCRNAKIYVGKCSVDRFEARMDEHYLGKGSSWTKKHPPVEILEVYEEDRGKEFEEDFYVLKFMKQFGIEHVRGGSFSTDTLSEEVIEVIQRMIAHADNRCLGCGEAGHYVKSCPQKQHFSSFLSNRELLKLKILDDYYKSSRSKSCDKCQRTGHSTEDCYASKTANGVQIIDSDYEQDFENDFHLYCVRCGRNGHLASDCYANKTATGRKIGNQNRSSAAIVHVCHRCGRDGHEEADCFATTTNTGTSLSSSQFAVSQHSQPLSSRCGRCNREGHVSDECYANTYDHGAPIESFSRSSTQTVGSNILNHIVINVEEMATLP